MQSLRRLPGVLAVEPVRVMGARFRNGHLASEGLLQGLPAGGTMRRALGPSLLPLATPPPGLLLPQEMLDRLDAGPGDVVRVEALDGTGRIASARIAGVSGQLFGFVGTIELSALDRLFGDQGAATGASVLDIWRPIPSARTGSMRC